jgi:hypothetical protein
MGEVTVGVAIPTIPPRKMLLGRALTSVLAQERPADHISIAVDAHREGAARTRNRAWRALDTDYVGFLDDDDEFLPMHLGHLLQLALDTDADLVYPWFTTVPAGNDPFPETHFTEPWDPAEPRITTVCCLWKRSALEQVGGFATVGPTGIDGRTQNICEEHLAVLKLNEQGGKIMHLVERTFLWHHHNLYGGTLSGLPNW